MKILFVGFGNSVFLKGLAGRINNSSNNFQVDVFSLINLDKNEYSKIYGKIINGSIAIHRRLNLPYLKRILRKHNFRKKFSTVEKYDIIHIHFLSEEFHFIADIIEKKAKFLCVSIWGADFYRSSYKTKQKQYSLLQKASNIVFTNSSTLNDFKREYDEFSNKLDIIRFGSEIVEIFKTKDLSDKQNAKTRLGLQENDYIITVGYCGNPVLQHLQIIEQLSKIKKYLPKHAVTLLPMTYSAQSNYIQEVKTKLLKEGFKYKVLESYLENHEIADIRIATDIYFHMNITDQLSASLLEHLIAKNIVITGSWLPYHELDEIKIKYHKVENLSEIPGLMKSIFKELVKEKEAIDNNTEKLKGFIEWDNSVINWLINYQSMNK